MLGGCRFDGSNLPRVQLRYSLVYTLFGSTAYYRILRIQKVLELFEWFHVLQSLISLQDCLDSRIRRKMQFLMLRK
uniref:Uncharacterized protein n=1 Tax=Brassica campestris TaxID=3711 RepID=A0A3P5YFP5_BRACM|nr:unnamed protein product [Brassica rapa]